MDLLVTEAGVVDCRRAQRPATICVCATGSFTAITAPFHNKREQGIRLAIDVDMRLDLQLPGLTDNLAFMMNYPAVYRLIQCIQSEIEFAALLRWPSISPWPFWEFTLVAEVTILARPLQSAGGRIDGCI